MIMYNKTIHFFKELHRRNKIFFYLGMGLLLLFFISLIAFQFCAYSVVDICRWLKPSKFTLSFAMYVFSLGWYLEYLKNYLGEKKIVGISWLITLLIIIEMVLILFQTWANSNNYFQSRFSNETAQWINRNFYLFGNSLIIANVAMGAYVALQFFRKISLTPTVYLWGIRTGFFIFILSGFLGGFLIEHYGQLPPDPNYYGIPFTRFSSIRDNIISLHFFGIHSLQILPFSCYFFQKYIGKIFILSYVGLYVLLSLFFILKA